MSDVMEYRASKRSRSRSPDHRSRQRTRNSGRYEDSRRRKRRPEISKYSSSSHIEKTNRNYALSVFVGNLPFDCSWTDLKNHFESIGEVVRADIVTSQGKLRGMGDIECVKRAIDKLHHTVFMDREIFVREDNPPPTKTRTKELYRHREPRPGNQVFVSNVPYRVTREELRDMFEAVGPVVDTEMRVDDRGRPRGVGIVSFEDPQHVPEAISRFNGLEIDGRNIIARDHETIISRDHRHGERHTNEKKADPAPKLPPHEYQEPESFTEGVKGNGPQSSTIYVSNLPFSTHNEDLYDLMESAGLIVKAEIQKIEGRFRGNGVVQFETEEDASVALEQLNGYTYGGRDLQISYAKYP